MNQKDNIDNLRTQLVTLDSDNVNRTTPRQFLLKYLSYWPLFTFCLLLSFSIAFLYLRYKVPVYQSNIKILVTDDSKKSGKDLSTAILDQIVSNGKSNIANELEIIKSRTLMGKVVRDLGLNIVYQSLGNIRETEIYDTSDTKFIRFSNIKDSLLNFSVGFKIENNKIYSVDKKNKVEIPNNNLVKTPLFDYIIRINNFRSNQVYKATWMAPSKMAAILASQIDAEPLNKDASIMSVSLQSTIPNKGNDILNQLAYDYAESNVEEKNRTVENTIRFIDDRLLLISGELGGVESSLQKFRQQNNVIDVSGQENAAFDRLKETRDKLDESDVKIQVASMVASYVNDPARKYSLVPSSLGIEDVTLLELVKAYNEQVLQREELLKTVAPANIAVTTIESQLEQLQVKIIESVNNVKRAYSSVYNKAKSEYDNILQNINTVPQKEKELLEISRQQGIKEKLYLYLLEKREESALTKASAIANSIPIDKAITSTNPVSPNKTLITIFAFLVGAGLPVLFIYLKDLFNDKVVTKDDIVRVTKAPIIGEINHSQVKERKIIVNKSRGVVPEQFRIIRTNLQYFLSNHIGSTTVLFTSSMSSEGKTFISMNFGAVLAQSNKRVIIVEFDLRKPKIASALNISNSTGITNYLSGNIPLTDLIVQVPNTENYYLLPSGPIPPNPSELLLNPQLDKLFAELKNNFDYIIIDSPPVGIVSDAKVMAKYSDLSLYVIRQRYTFKRQLELANDFYVQQNFNNMALIVNDVELKGASGYYGYGNYYSYGYGSYNYDYSYGYGYTNEENKASWWKRLLGGKYADDSDK